MAGYLWESTPIPKSDSKLVPTVSTSADAKGALQLPAPVSAFAGRSPVVDATKATLVVPRVLTLPVGVPPVPLQARKSKGRRGGRSSLTALPRRIDVVDVVRCTRRFYVIAVLNLQAVTVNGILGAIGGICTITNSAIRPLAGTFRVISVTIYGATSTSGSSAAVCSVNWAGSQKEDRDTEPVTVLPVGALGEVVRIHSRPPRNTLAAMWKGNDTSSDTLFYLTALNSGAIIDLDLEYTLSANVINTAITVTTATLGNFYRLALDDPSGTQNIVPVGYATTT